MTQAATTRLTEVHELLQRHESGRPDVRLPVHPRLTTAFPRGLRTGAVHSVIGSSSAALALLSAASRQGWCAAVGLPDLSIEAAARWGTDLDQLVLVPTPGPSPWDAVAALVDAADLILTASAPIAPAQARRLEARMRARKTALLVLGEWPQPSVTIRARTVGWAGLRHGSGCLTEQHLELDVTERHRQRTTRIVVPEQP